MQSQLVDKSGNTKFIKLTNNGRSVEVALNYVETRGVVQARQVLCSFGKVTRWKEHGSFIQLLEKELDCSISGTRQEFIERLYSNNN